MFLSVKSSSGIFGSVVNQETLFPEHLSKWERVTVIGLVLTLLPGL